MENNTSYNLRPSQRAEEAVITRKHWSRDAWSVSSYFQLNGKATCNGKRRSSSTFLNDSGSENLRLLTDQRAEQQRGGDEGVHKLTASCLRHALFDHSYCLSKFCPLSIASPNVSEKHHCNKSSALLTAIEDTKDRHSCISSDQNTSDQSGYVSVDRTIGSHLGRLCVSPTSCTADITKSNESRLANDKVTLHRPRKRISSRVRVTNTKHHNVSNTSNVANITTVVASSSVTESNCNHHSRKRKPASTSLVTSHTTRNTVTSYCVDDNYENIPLTSRRTRHQNSDYRGQVRQSQDVVWEQEHSYFKVDYPIVSVVAEPMCLQATDTETYSIGLRNRIPTDTKSCKLDGDKHVGMSGDKQIQATQFHYSNSLMKTNGSLSDTFPAVGSVTQGDKHHSFDMSFRRDNIDEFGQSATILDRTKSTPDVKECRQNITSDEKSSHCLIDAQKCNGQMQDWDGGTSVDEVMNTCIHRKHIGKRKRSRKPVCARRYLPRNINMDTKLPPGIVKSVLFEMLSLPDPKHERHGDVNAVEIDQLEKLDGRLQSDGKCNWSSVTDEMLPASEPNSCEASASARIITNDFGYQREDN